MKRLATFILMCSCVLVPRSVRADDGGWWDAIWKWDQKFMGASSEIHLLCLDARGRRVEGCEEWFRNVKRSALGQPVEHRFAVKNPATATGKEPLTSYEPIKHEIDFRFGYGRNYGLRYDSSENPPIDGSINVVTLMGMYHYHVTKYVALGAGAGAYLLWGKRFDAFSRTIIKPVSVTLHPFPGWPAFAVRPEVNYIPQGFSAADFGDVGPAYTFHKESDWNVSVAFGFDLRRVGW